MIRQQYRSMASPRREMRGGVGSGGVAAIKHTVNRYRLESNTDNFRETSSDLDNIDSITTVNVGPI